MNKWTTISFFVIILLLTGCLYESEATYSVFNDDEEIIIPYDSINYYENSTQPYTEDEQYPINNEVIYYYASQMQSSEDYLQNIDEEKMTDEVLHGDMFPSHWHAWGYFALYDLRQDVVAFFYATYNLSADWIKYWDWVNFSSEEILGSMGFRIAQAKMADPALYAEIIESINYKSDKLKMDENIASLVDFLFVDIQREYERLRSLFAGLDHDDYCMLSFVWFDYIDWASYVFNPYTLMGMEYLGINLLFKFGFIEQGVQHIM